MMDYEDIYRLLVGRSVIKVSDDSIALDDGRVLTLKGNHGCGGCSAGHYDLKFLNDMPVNAVMDVELVINTPPDEYDNTTYRLFVLAEDRRIELATFEGHDGNGYYGTGFWIEVVQP